MSIPSRHRRIFDIAFKNRVGHLSSAITASDCLHDIYTCKPVDEPVILSCGHCFLGQAAVIEEFEGHDAERLFAESGCHPHRDPAKGIHCSTGSLGLGITIAVGMALANKSRKVHVLISDGELDNGACLEALRFKRREKLDNLQIYLNLNGRTTCRELDVLEVVALAETLDPLMTIYHTSCDQYAPLRGIVGHYKVLSQAEYDEVIRA